jgi:glycosyltransferase involved in cell wall biosynthesis
VEVGTIADAARAGAGWRGWRARLAWAKLRGHLRRLAARADLLTVASEVERGLVGAAGVPAARVRVVPNGVDAARLGEVAPDPEPGAMVYPGALGYAANADAVGFFCREVLPRVRAAAPRARLVVTGRADGPARTALAGAAGVAFTGHVPDIRDVLARSQLCVVPLRVGGGTRLKILEAMAAGVPVLSTRKGAEGLAVVPGVHLLVADTPAELAAAALRLLGDGALRRELADRARALVRARYDWAAIGAAFRDLVEAVAAGRRPAEGAVP